MSEATVKFGAVDDGLTKTIKQINKQMGDFGSETKQTSEKVNMSFAAMAKAGAALAVGVGVVKGAFSLAKSTINSFGDALDMGGRLSDLAARTGIAAGEILVLERAFQNSGAGAEKAGPSINKMQRAIVEAGQGVTTYQRAFDTLGISLEDLSKQNAADQFQTIAKAIASTQDPAQRAATAMQIFGRAGAELLPLFGSMSSEIDTARGQLGLMPQIMNKLAERFDGISDKITVIKGKFVEFATGVLSTVVPAIDLITEALSKFDAAKFGRDIANVFVGAGNAMKGFDTALKAIQGGEGMLGVKAAFLSIKAQVIDTANSVYKNFKAAFAAVATFAKEALGPGSGLFETITLTFSMIGDIIAKKISESIYEVFKDSTFFSGIATSSLINSSKLQREIIKTKKLIGESMTEIVDDFAEGGAKASQAFQDKFNETGNIIDDASVKAELDAINAEIQTRLEDKKVEVKIEAKAEGELAKGIFQGMSAKGGLQLFPNLEADKVNFDELAKSVIEAGKKTKENAQDVELKAINTAVQLDRGGQSLKEAAKELTKSEQAAKRIADAMANARIDRGGRLEKELQQALQLEKFAAAQRIQRQLALREERDMIREMFGPKAIKDIAKDLGIDAFGKSSKELREEIKKWMDQQKNMIEGDKAKDGKCPNSCPMPHPPEPTKPDPQPEDPHKENTLLEVVKTIKNLVQKLERKLPTPALV